MRGRSLFAYSSCALGNLAVASLAYAQPAASPGTVFCPGGDMVIANDSAEEAQAGARPFPCKGALFVLVCHGNQGQYGVFVHEIAPGRHREVETPAGSSFDAQCDKAPARQCPARYCVGP